MGYWLLNCDDECINGANATGFVFLALGAGLYFPMTVNKISMKTFGRDIWESKNKKKRENNNKDDLLAAELAEDWFQGLSKGGGLYVGYWLLNCDDECINGANATGFVFLALGAGLYFPMTVNKISMKTFGRDIWESKNKKKRENNNKDDLLAAELAEDWFQGLSKGGGLYVGYWLQNWLRIGSKV